MSREREPTMLETTVRRDREVGQLADAIRIEPACDDPQAVLALIRRSGPYQQVAGAHKTDTLQGDKPFFRAFWATGGKIRLPGAELVFDNPRFIEAAKRSFRSEVVEPSTLLLNVSTPMGAGPPHLDLPFFRGASGWPFWLLAFMGISGLFHDYAIPIASTISWFYRGEGGDFEYWPEGGDGPSVVEPAPLWNAAVVADNEYMYHRIGKVGRPDQYLRPGQIGRDAVVRYAGDRRWEIADRGDVQAVYDEGDVRFSLLWKAFVFKDQAAAAVFRDRSHDLTPEKVVAIFATDLKRRGLTPVEPTDPFNDEAWQIQIQASYTRRFSGTLAAA